MPLLLGVRKERARLPHQAWRRRVRPGELVYTRAPESRALLLQARARSFATAARRAARRVSSMAVCVPRVHERWEGLTAGPNRTTITLDMGPVIAGTAWSILWRVLLFAVVFGLFGALLIVPFDPVLAEWRQAFPMRAHLYGQSASALAVLAATWTVTRFVDRRPFRSIGFAPGRVFRDLAMGFALGAAWLATSLAGLWAFGWVSREDPVAVSASLLLVSALAVLLNVLTQQLLLFGYILQTIRSRAGFPLALLLSAAAFSGLHAGGFHGEWLPAVNVFGAGALFCLAYAATGNLWLPLAAHFTWNLVLGPVLGLTVSGSSQLGLGWRMLSVEGPPLITGGDFGPEGGLMVTLTTALLVAAMSWLHNRRPASGTPETSPSTT